MLLAALLLTGCAVNPALRLSEAMPDAGTLVLGDVPFHPQTAFQCGPAALATLLGASGVAVAPEAKLLVQPLTSERNPSGYMRMPKVPRPPQQRTGTPAARSRAPRW